MRATDAKPSSRRCREAFLLGLALIAYARADTANTLKPAEYRELKKRIDQGQAHEVLERAKEAIKDDPDSVLANGIQADALVALGRADEAEAGLVRWVDRDWKDPVRVEDLSDFYLRMQRWDSLVAMTPRIAALPEDQRTEQLRGMVDKLCAGHRCPLAAAPVRMLMSGGSDEARSAILRALDAATRQDVRRMVAELPSFSATDDPSGARKEAFILVSRRAVSAIQASASNQIPATKELPPTGGADADTLDVKPVLVKKVQPVYPSVARRAHIEGKVVLRALVLSSGETIVTGLYSASNPMFVKPAAEGVAQWHYDPGRLKGRAVDTDYAIRVDFVLTAP